jgi:ABC-2 type transport system ATP-binding protein
MKMNNLIEARNLNKSYGSLKAVRDLNLHVSSGEIYGLIGPDGAGKTTTIRLLCGGLRPDAYRKGDRASEANIFIAGYDLHRQPEGARSQIGYLAQRFSLYEDLTVLENIRFFAEQRGLPAAEWRPRCMEILDFVGLAQFIDRRAGQLSGGMKQKLGLAAALVHRPQVLLLDEPTTGVDPVTRQDFWQLIIRLAGESQMGGQGQNVRQTAVLVSTPYMDEAARCSRIGFMVHGQLILEGAPGELRKRLQGRILELTGQPLVELRKIARTEPGVQDVQMFGDRLHLRLQAGQAEKVLAHLQESLPGHGIQGFRLRSIQPQLEDVFMDLLEAQR